MLDGWVEVLARGPALAAGYWVSLDAVRRERPLAALRGLSSEVALLLAHPDCDLWGLRPGAARYAVDHRATLRSPGTTTGGAAGPGSSDRQYGRLHRRKRRGDAVRGAGPPGFGDRAGYGGTQRLAA